MRTPLLSLAACLALVAGCSDGKNDSKPNGPPVETPDAGAPLTFDFAPLDEELFAGAWKSEGLVVLHEGRIVHEKYAAGFDENKRHITYSVSKSVGSALTGIAVRDGLLKLDDSVCTYITPPEGADPTLCETKVDHVLRMLSGLAWEEGYADPTTSNVLPMLYGDEADMGLYVAKRPRKAPAGTAWNYSTGDANLMARVLKGALKDQDMRAWAKAKFFDPAGLSGVIFEADRSGALVFGSSCFMTVRDMAKFGQIYLDDGMAGTTRVLPSEWVAFTKTPVPPLSTPTPRTAGGDPGSSGGSYGAAFWLNAVTPTASPDTFAYPDTPGDMFSAEGHWGQKIFVVPSRKLVVARVGNDRTPVFDSGPMMKLATAAIDGGHR